MPTIRIEYEVPEGDCVLCEHTSICFGGGLCCTLFSNECLETDADGVFMRCQACIDAEVKEG